MKTVNNLKKLIWKKRIFIQTMKYISLNKELLESTQIKKQSVKCWDYSCFIKIIS